MISVRYVNMVHGYMCMRIVVCFIRKAHESEMLTMKIKNW